MSTAVRHGLPAAVADRLTDEARASFAEAPRDARFKLLCQALSVTEAVLLVGGQGTRLRPLTRAGNRRYYRPDDVALVRRIHHLLNVEGYTVKGVQKLLSGKTAAPADTPAPVAVDTSAPQMTAPAPLAAPPSYIPDLVLIRDRLKIALAAARD